VGRTVRRARLYDVGTTLLSFGRLAALHRTMVELAGIRSGERMGIDPALEMVELARRKAAQDGVTVRFEVGVIEALPYPPGHFDVVLSSLMLRHLPDEAEASRADGDPPRAQAGGAGGRRLQGDAPGGDRSPPLRAAPPDRVGVSAGSDRRARKACRNVSWTRWSASVPRETTRQRYRWIST
jgi:SAM-dependent methyltransferase